MKFQTRLICLLLGAALAYFPACSDEGTGGETADAELSADAGEDAPAEQVEVAVTIFSIVSFSPGSWTVRWGLSNEDDVAVEITECTWEARRVDDGEMIAEGVVFDDDEVLEPGTADTEEAPREFDANLGDPPNYETVDAEMEVACVVGAEEFTISETMAFEWDSP